MDFLVSPVAGIQAIVWLPFLALAFGVVAGLVIEGLHRRRVQSALRAADVRAGIERDRASAAERELESERAQGPTGDVQKQTLASLARAFQELATAADPTELARMLARAVDDLQPAQFIVFVATDHTGKEFVLAAAGGRRECGWTEGARLGETTGRLGLVVRRGIAMDRREFEAEPPLVGDQLDATEPEEFVVDVAAPVVVGGNVVAIVSIGGSALPLEATRAGLEILTAYAAAVRRALDAIARNSRLMNTDAMTGLGSKSWFVAEGAESLYACRTAGETAAVVILSIDDFKGYVVRSGHETGDLLLKGVAEVARPLCVDGVMLARWSGAEFVALLPRANARDAHLFADRLRAAVSAIGWPNGQLQPRGRLTMSAGISFLPSCGDTLDDLIERAAESLADARWTGDTTRSAAAATLLRDATQSTAVSAKRESAPAPTR